MAFPLLKPSLKKERVWLTGIRRGGQTVHDFEASTLELTRLIDTAGGEIVGQTSQHIDAPTPRTFIGKGKVEEILHSVQKCGIDTVAIDDELTPTQNANLERAWNVKVLDRTAVILDIFAKRAHTKEGRLQVELAQLEYIQPRLKGMWAHFSQQTGGIGTRGPGETQLEVDRRRVRERITRLKKRLEEVKTHRMIQRQKREAVPLPVFSIVGYTNAGKSTLFNALTKAEVFVEDKLFATLDPTVRRLKLPSGRHILLTDTVGFIRKLPHTLIEAFKATFEEVAFSDGLIHVVDVSDAEVFQHMQTVEEVLLELNLNHKPFLTVFNKIDRGPARLNGCKGIGVSALTGEGLAALIEAIEGLLRASLKRVQFFLPHGKGEILPQLYTLGHVLSVQHQSGGIAVDCEIAQKFVNRFQPYLAKESRSG